MVPLMGPEQGGSRHDDERPCGCHHARMGPSGVPVRVLVVDDHPAARALLAAAMAEDGADVVGEADTAAGALDAATALLPDVVVLDVQLPDGDGITVSGRLACLPRPPAVVLVSGREAATYGARLRSAPVAGFLTKARFSGAAVRRLLDRSREGAP
jgi:DNA-binding NarL/FixJ family response regulator